MAYSPSEAVFTSLYTFIYVQLLLSGKWRVLCDLPSSLWLYHFVLGRGGVRNESRAAKVALMKMKMKATGDGSIPQVCQVKSIQSHF